MNWLLPVVLFISLSAQAQKYYPANFESMPKLLSFHQLMYLPDAKREEYIKDARLALADMEVAMARAAKSNKSAEFEIWREHVQDLIARFGDLALPSAQAQASITCPRGYNFDQITKGCSRIVGRGTQCRPNEVQQIDERDNTYCALRIAQPLTTPSAPTPAGTTNSRVIPTPPSTPTPPSGLFAPADPRTIQRFERAAPGANPEGDRPVNPAPAAAAGSGTSALAAAAVGAGTSTPTRRAIPSQCKKREENTDYHKDAAAHVAGMSPPNPNLRNCIMGGMFSSYRNGQIRAGNCKRVNEFPPGTSAGAEKLKCPANKGMCNPMLYCGPKKGEAHCLVVNQNFTKSCEAKATDKCDPFKGDTMVAGAKENWEEFKHDMDNLCLGSGAGNRFNEYFCEECKALEVRTKKIQEKFAAYTSSMPSATPIQGAPLAPATRTNDPRIFPASTTEQ